MGPRDPARRAVRRTLRRKEDVLTSACRELGCRSVVAIDDETPRPTALRAEIDHQPSDPRSYSAGSSSSPNRGRSLVRSVRAGSWARSSATNGTGALSPSVDPPHDESPFGLGEVDDPPKAGAQTSNALHPPPRARSRRAAGHPQRHASIPREIDDLIRHAGMKTPGRDTSNPALASGAAKAARVASPHGARFTTCAHPQGSLVLAGG